MNRKLANGMKMWKGSGNTNRLLLFSLKGIKILHQERRGQVKTMAIEHFNGILFHKCGPANKQHTNKLSSLVNVALNLLGPISHGVGYKFVRGRQVRSSGPDRVQVAPGGGTRQAQDRSLQGV